MEFLQSRQRDGLIPKTQEDIKAVEKMFHALCEEDLQ